VKGVISLHDEKQLLQSFCDGDFSETDVLIRQYEDKLYHLCIRLTRNRTDADDLYQQTWLVAVRKAHTFRGKSLTAWLYTICMNTHRDNWRKKQRRAGIEGVMVSAEEREYMLEAATDGVSAEAAALQRYEDMQLGATIAALPEKHRMPVLLHYFEGLGYEQTAMVLGIPVGTVKSRLSYAKKKLRREMDNRDDG
jgi:RNA polymerase sigma-70 factor (ECF subfamily)